jgi:hypothetical protein
VTFMLLSSFGARRGLEPFAASFQVISQQQAGWNCR